MKKHIRMLHKRKLQLRGCRKIKKKVYFKIEFEKFYFNEFLYVFLVF